jgi:hypothetical protein
MNKARPTQLKREREKSKRERQQKKIARRADSKARRDAAPLSGLERLDQEIAQIVPGPQPPPEED